MLITTNILYLYIIYTSIIIRSVRSPNNASSVFRQLPLPSHIALLLELLFKKLIILHTFRDISTSLGILIV